jgi:hypothetical protein
VVGEEISSSIESSLNEGIIACSDTYATRTCRRLLAARELATKFYFSHKTRPMRTLGDQNTLSTVSTEKIV